ncbi:molybdenum cofactor biosynthesis protein MoeB [Gemmatimonadetes bacterium T265]|nr:molybdenum cofactor biosynthesis protein MoeB [Gemmatimonadetes bacterium T265]
MFPTASTCLRGPGRAEGWDGAPSADFSPDEIARYSRHLILPEVGFDGQARLKAARVLLVGAGGLGSPLALYLAAAGVGTIGVVDFDIVEASNLHRQVLHGTRDLGRPKLESARERIADVNPHVRVEGHPVRLDAGNALDIVRAYDVVVDGTDNFPTRYLVNDACVLAGRPNVYGSVYRFEGQLSVFGTRGGPCYRCLFREPPPQGLVPSCAEGGVLGVLPGVIGSMQALETIKLLLGLDDTLAGRLLLFDALGMRWRERRVRRDPACPACGDHPTITELADAAAFCAGAHGPASDGVPTIAARELASRLSAGEGIILLDVRDPHEWRVANLHEYGARLVPLGEFEDSIATIDLGAPIVVHCRSGARSATAVRRLLDAGATRVWNLDGGMLAWRRDVDPSKPG